MKISESLQLNAEMVELRAWWTTRLLDDALDFLFAFIGARNAKHAQKQVWPKLTERSSVAAIIWLQSAAEYAKVLGE